MGLHTQQGQLTDDELIRLMVLEPNLIRRPLFIVDGEIVAGFDKTTKAELANRLGTSL